MVKILIAESLDEDVLEKLRTTTKIEFDYKPTLTPLALEYELAAYEGLIVRPKEVTANAINNAPNLKLIIRGGAGVNSIALDAAKAKGVVVENTPGLNSDATAEFTFTLMLQIFKGQELMFELKDKRLGIIGYGNVGKRVERIAQGFGMKTSVFKRGDNLHEFLKQGHEVVSLHVPLTEETKGFIGKAEFECMTPHTLLINTACPQLVDAEAFGEALNNGILAGYAIDGDEDLLEPFAAADPIGRGILTPHIADATTEAQVNIAKACLTQAIEFFENGKEINRVV